MLAVVVIAVVILTGGTDHSDAASTSPAAPGALGCDQLTAAPAVAGRLSFADGGSAPTGVPLPDARPAHVCSGSPTDGAEVDALIWTDVTTGSYEHTLTDEGWASRPANDVVVYTRGSSAYEIAVLTVDDALVAIYHRGDAPASGSPSSRSG